MNQNQNQNSLYSRFGNFVANAAKNKNRLLMGVFALIMLQLADIVLTLLALSYNLAKEANPMFDNASMYYFVVAKIVAISLLLIGYAYVEKVNRFRQVYAGILTIFIPVYLVVVVNNMRFFL